jgi:hypothetical protein
VFQEPLLDHGAISRIVSEVLYESTDLEPGLVGWVADNVAYALIAQSRRVVTQNLVAGLYDA